MKKQTYDFKIHNGRSKVYIGALTKKQDNE